MTTEDQHGGVALFCKGQECERWLRSIKFPVGLSSQLQAVMEQTEYS